MNQFKTGNYGLLNYIDDNLTNEHSHSIAMHLEAIILSCPDLHTGKYTLVDSIKQLENQIMADIQLTQTEKTSLLRTASVSRYSTESNSLWKIQNIHVDPLTIPSSAYKGSKYGQITSFWSWLSGAVKAVVGVVIYTTPLRALLGIAIDGGVALATANPWIGGGASVGSVLIMNGINWP